MFSSALRRGIEPASSASFGSTSATMKVSLEKVEGDSSHFRPRGKKNRRARPMSAYRMEREARAVA
jgi:hypothetical protein